MAGDYAHAELIGVENFKALVKELGSDRLLGAARKELQRSLTKMRDDARNNAPYGEGDEGVHLRDTIHYKIGDDSKGLRGELIASSEHAVFVEMGTGPRGEAGIASANVSPQLRERVTYSADGWSYTKGGKNVLVKSQGQAPQPYLYPAYKAYEGDMMPAIRKAIAQAVESASAQTDGGTAE